MLESLDMTHPKIDMPLPNAEKLAGAVNLQRLKNSPVFIGEAELLEMYKMIIKELQ